MRALSDFIKIIDLHTIVVTVLAVAATYLCGRFGCAANMPSGLIGVAIIFPIVFSINAAYKRREEALKFFSSIKAHAAALYYAHRDWLPGDGREHAGRGQDLFGRLLTSMREYFRAPKSERETRFEDVYRVFSDFSRSHELMRQAGVPANEISRANQYLKIIMVEFERMKNILLYRTPITLRAYSRVFLNAFPVLFGPYFAYLAREYYSGVGYLVAVLYSLVLVSLDNIQEDLEIPFDAVGEDDIRLDVAGNYQAMFEHEQPIIL